MGQGTQPALRMTEGEVGVVDRGRWLSRKMGGSDPRCTVHIKKKTFRTFFVHCALVRPLLCRTSGVEGG